jgi:Glutamate 5-kinase
MCYDDGRMDEECEARATNPRNPRTLVVQVGTSTLPRETGSLNLYIMVHLAACLARFWRAWGTPPGPGVPRRHRLLLTQLRLGHAHLLG